MKKLFAGLVVAGALAVPFAGAASAAAGCQEFGQATAAGAKGVGWGADTKAQNEAGPPGVIATNVAGAKAGLCGDA